MSTNEPTLRASDVISDVETRLGDTNLDSADYLPWVSYAYQKVFLAISSVGTKIREDFFGASQVVNLEAGSSSVSISENIPRFGGFLRVEVKYGGTNDTEWNVATRMPAVAFDRNQDELTTTYRDKTKPYYRKIGDSLIIVPTPPTTDSGQAQATVWYVKRPYQITSASDIIDIPYRFTYPIAEYVLAKATYTENEDVSAQKAIEEDFENSLLRLGDLVSSEFDEHDGTSQIMVVDDELSSSLF